MTIKACKFQDLEHLPPLPTAGKVLVLGQLPWRWNDIIYQTERGKYRLLLWQGHLVRMKVPAPSHLARRNQEPGKTDPGPAT